MHMSEQEKAARYDKHVENKRNSQKKRMEEDPLFKEKASIRSLKYVAKKKGNLARVKELEERYEMLKVESKKLQSL